MMLSDSPDMSYFDLGVSDWKNPNRNDLGIDAKKARSINYVPDKSTIRIQVSRQPAYLK